MNENADFIAKLRQIEEHIVLLARSLRGRLEFGGLSVLRSDAAARATGGETKPPP